ncbi:MAG: PEFG-CTERM sorting domain-containing protein, partial [Nitrosotalea sp.]
TSDTAPPIADTGLDNMTETIQYGGQTKALSFDASDDTPGEYDSAVRPSQPGTYNIVIKGTIGAVTIPPTTYPLQDVETKDAYYFPPMTGQNMSSNMPGTNMSSGMNMTNTSGNQTVPEFGPVASLVLVIAIISVVLVTGRTRGFLKF